MMVDHREAPVGQPLCARGCSPRGTRSHRRGHRRPPGRSRSLTSEPFQDLARASPVAHTPSCATAGSRPPAPLLVVVSSAPRRPPRSRRPLGRLRSSLGTSTAIPVHHDAHEREDSARQHAPAPLARAAFGPRDRGGVPSLPGRAPRSRAPSAATCACDGAPPPRTRRDGGRARRVKGAPSRSTRSAAPRLEPDRQPLQLYGDGLGPGLGPARRRARRTRLPVRVLDGRHARLVPARSTGAPGGRRRRSRSPSRWHRAADGAPQAGGARLRIVNDRAFPTPWRS